MIFTRRSFVRLAAMAGIALSMLPAAGCNQQTLADLIGVAGTSLSLLLGVLGQGNTALAANLAALFAVARNAVLTWVKGSSAQDVIQALNDVSAVIGQIPVTNATSLLIGIAIAAIEHVIEAIDPSASPLASAQAATIRAARVNWSRFAMAPKDIYKSAWNGEIANHPELAAAILK
jgi:hypothetical protein